MAAQHQFRRMLNCNLVRRNSLNNLPREISPLRFQACAASATPKLTRRTYSQTSLSTSHKKQEGGNGSNNNEQDDCRRGQKFAATGGGVVGFAFSAALLSQNNDDDTVVRKPLGAEVLEVKNKDKGQRRQPRKSLKAASSDSDSDEDGDTTSDSEIDSDSESEEEEKSKSETGNGSKKEKVGFRDRKIIDYENRIRNYSTPDKIFRYFATYKSTLDNEVFMTPGDFLRSLTPGIKQPEGLGLDQFRKFDPNTMSTINLHNNIDENITPESIFYHLGTSGLISFSDYVFLLTILSTSRRQFEIAFRMFDLNGDGDVDAEEFAQVQNIIRQTTSVGSRHRDHSTTGSTLKGINSALANYFFGPNLDGKLTIERFLEFQEQLQREILSLEFSRKNPDESTGKINEKEFAELLLTYADYTAKKRSAVIKRVKKRYHKSKTKPVEAVGEAEPELPVQEQAHGISLEDYIKIFAVLIHIDDVDKALYFYNLAGASISPATLKHVAKVCANVDLSDHLVEVIFTIFDEDGDGALSNKEFVSVMKNKLKRGLEKPKDTGLINLMGAIAKCARLPGLESTSSLDHGGHH